MNLFNSPCELQIPSLLETLFAAAANKYTFTSAGGYKVIGRVRQQLIKICLICDSKANIIDNFPERQGLEY